MAKSANFGSGFALGFGQSLRGLPDIVNAIYTYQQQADLADVQKKEIGLRNQMLELQLRRLVLDPVTTLQQTLGALSDAGLIRGAPGGGPAPPTVNLPEALPLLGEGAGYGVLAPAQAPQGTTSGTAEPAVGPGPLELQSLSINPAEGATTVSLGRPRLPAQEIQSAQEAARALGYSPDRVKDGAAKILAAKILPEDARSELLAQLVEEAKGQGATPIDIERAIGTAQQREAQTAGMVAGSRAAAEAGVALQTQPQLQAATAQARSRATLQAEREPARVLVGKLRTTLEQIDLPTTGTERVTKSPELMGKLLAQSDKNVVLFNSLKEGFLSAIVRAAGERGTLTDQDIARARALMPQVVPIAGRLPDTKEIALAKLDQLAALLGELGRKDPQLLQELGGGPRVPGSTPKDVGIRLPPGWQMKVTP